MLERVLNVLVCLVLSYSSKEERGFGVKVQELFAKHNKRQTEGIKRL